MQGLATLSIESLIMLAHADTQNKATTLIVYFYNMAVLMLFTIGFGRAATRTHKLQAQYYKFGDLDQLCPSSSI